MVEFPDKTIYLYNREIDFRKGIASLSNLIHTAEECPAGKDHRDRKRQYMDVPEQAGQSQVYVSKSRKRYPDNSVTAAPDPSYSRTAETIKTIAVSGFFMR